MENKLSKRVANIHTNIIAVFYLISGVWEYLLVTRGESLTSYLLGLYHNYVAIVGFVTIILGIGLFNRSNIFRVFALILAWWNLFTAPLLELWWIIYAVYFKKYTAEPVFWSMWLGIFIIITFMTAIRIYIIRMLRIDRAGYIFLKENET